MRLADRKPQREKQPLTLGARYGQWTVIGLALPLVEVRCACGREQWLKMQVLRHDQSTQCRACRIAARRGQTTHLNTLGTRQVWDALEALSELQKQYAARLIHSRRQIQGEQIGRLVVTEAIEMARLLTPAQIEEELRHFAPRYHAEACCAYRVYESPRGER